MIPKIIHACWFGTLPIPEEHKKYIEGWRKVMPNYEIRVWTYDDFSKELTGSYKFFEESVQRKAWAFTSDFFRVYILKKYGGIYVDTDVEILKPFDEFLNAHLFMSYIFDDSIGTAVIGVEPNSPIMNDWLKILQDDYEKTGEFTVSNFWVTKYFLDKVAGFKLDGKRQSLPGGIELYPKDYFERLQLKKNSGGGYCVHHCEGAWRKKTKLKAFVKKSIVTIFGKKCWERLTLLRLTKKQPYYSEYKKAKKQK